MVQLYIPFLSPVWTSQHVKSKHTQILEAECVDVYIHALPVGLFTFWNCCTSFFWLIGHKRLWLYHWVNKVMEHWPLYDREVHFAPYNLPQWDVSCHRDLSRDWEAEFQPCRWALVLRVLTASTAATEQQRPAGWEAQLAEWLTALRADFQLPCWSWQCFPLHLVL